MSSGGRKGNRYFALKKTVSTWTSTAAQKEKKNVNNDRAKRKKNHWPMKIRERDLPLREKREIPQIHATPTSLKEI